MAILAVIINRICKKREAKVKAERDSRDYPINFERLGRSIMKNDCSPSEYFRDKVEYEEFRKIFERKKGLKLPLYS